MACYCKARSIYVMYMYFILYIYTFDFIGVLKSNAQLEGMLIDSENPGLIKWVIETYGNHSMLTQSCIPVKWNSSYFFACQSETPEGPGIPSDFLCEDVPGKHLSCQDGKHVHLLFPQQPDPIKYTATSIPVKKKKKEAQSRFNCRLTLCAM